MKILCLLIVIVGLLTACNDPMSNFITQSVNVEARELIPDYENCVLVRKDVYTVTTNIYYKAERIEILTADTYEGDSLCSLKKREYKRAEDIINHLKSCEE